MPSEETVKVKVARSCRYIYGDVVYIRGDELEVPVEAYESSKHVLELAEAEPKKASAKKATKKPEAKKG